MNQIFEFAGNHLILVSSFFFVLTLLIINLLQDAGGRSLAPLAAVQLMNREDALPLDVRSSADFEAGHIINAKHVPAADIKSKLEEIKSMGDRPILVYCESGSSSTAAVKQLRAGGVETVYSLKGGMVAWRADNLPLEKA